MDLEAVRDWRIPAGTKGVPVAAHGLPLRDVAGSGWNLLAGDVPLPAAVIRRSAVERNLQALHGYLDRAGMRIAPHGKTTMCPQLFARQVAAGAWGITVANHAQALVAAQCGVTRILIANQMVGDAEITALSQLIDAHPQLTLLSFVDSLAGLERIDRVLGRIAARRPFEVLVELGIAGKRCGVRGVQPAFALAGAVARFPMLRLKGVSGYEGVLVSGDAQADRRAVEDFIADLVQLYERCRDAGLLVADGERHLSAGGSAYFDLVAEKFRAVADPQLVPLVRSGCYLSHDSGFYQALLANVQARGVLGDAPDLRPALQVWAQVVSMPEPGLAIVGAGRRDFADDAGMPRPEQWARPGGTPVQLAAGAWTLFRMNDQHGYLRIPEDAALQVGDFVGFGISHPCTTLDKWPVLLEVDDGHVVLEALKTCF